MKTLIVGAGVIYGWALHKYPEVGYIKLPIWLTAFLLKCNFHSNESMQRYTVHATSDGSLRETKYFYEQMMCTASQIGIDMPEMKALRGYLNS